MSKPGQGVIDWYSDLDPDTQGDLTDYYNDIMYDSFANDEIYQTVFAQGSWGDIKDATFETFGEVKTYINDTIFATEHQKTYEDGEYVPSVDRSVTGGPKYGDVSEYYENVDKSLPSLYRTPSGPAMPHSMLKYSSRGHVREGVGVREGWDAYWQRGDSYKVGSDEPDYPGNVDTLGDYQKHLDEVAAKNVQDAQGDFNKTLHENQSRADGIWAQRTALSGKGRRSQITTASDVQSGSDFGNYDEEFEDDFEDIIGSKDKKDIQSWMAMSGINNFDGEGDLKRIKFVYDWFDGKLPTKEEFETKYGDPLIEWQKRKK
jgi:hypothetical protein